jgi:hypothetical protein
VKFFVCELKTGASSLPRRDLEPFCGHSGGGWFYFQPVSCLWLKMAKSKTVLLPPKTEPDEMIKSLTLKDDPNLHGSVPTVPAPQNNFKSRRGPKHKGAQELAQLYTTGKNPLA